MNVKFKMFWVILYCFTTSLFLYQCTPSDKRPNQDSSQSGLIDALVPNANTQIDIGNVATSVDLGIADNQIDRGTQEADQNNLPMIPTYDFSRVESAMNAMIEADEEMKGAALSIIHRDYGVVYKKAFGEFALDRVYLVASATKMVSAGILNKLHDQEILDLDEPLANLTTWGSGNPLITTAQLLSNSSGLIGILENTSFAGYFCQFRFLDDIQACAEEIFLTPEDDDLIDEPDTRFRYGGAQWQVAGAVAEIMSGKSWYELFNETYGNPCGLSSTGYANHILQFLSFDLSYPEGFDGDISRLNETENPWIEGGLYTTLSDYTKLLLMHLNGGICEGNRVHPESTIERMHEDRIRTVYQGSTGVNLGGVNMEGYGMGWWINRDMEGVVYDPGAYGAFPYLDKQKGYGAFIAIEMTAFKGATLYLRLDPLIQEALDLTD